MLADGLETYPVATYPSNGGWYSEWSGREAYASDAYASSGHQSFRLSGFGGWVRTDALALDLSAAMSLTTKWPCTARPNISTAPKSASRENEIERELGVQLIPFPREPPPINVKGTGPRIGGPPGADEVDTGLVWEYDRWYLLRADIDFAEGTVDFWIDGKQVAEDLIAAPREATGIFQLSTNYGYEDAAVYFDYISVEIVTRRESNHAQV